MTKTYVNPPIIEAVCEFRLPVDPKWDLTVPGLVYERLKEAFPNKEQRLVQEVGISNTSQGLEQQIRTDERAVFLAADRRTFVQVGRGILAVNRLRPYESWEAFRPSIDSAFRAMRDTIGIKSLMRIGLIYVNRIEVPGLNVDLDSYFEFRPFLGSKLPQSMASFLLGCVLPFADGRDACRVELTPAVADKPDTSAFRLTLDYYLARPESTEPDEALGWVDNAHGKIEALFEGCVSDRVRELFR